MVLSDLAPDILNQIINLLDGFELLGLWFCGSRHLNWKLSKGCGATVWKFCWSIKKTPFWPHVLQELPQIHELWLRLDTANRPFRTLAPQLLNLSPNLRILNCRFPFDHEVVLSAVRMAPERFQNLTTLICEGNGDNESENLFGTINLPNLTKLKLKVNAHFTKAHCTMMLSTLPPSLEHLNLTVDNFIIEEDAEFPRNLTTCHLYSNSDPVLVLSKLPPTLLDLRLRLSKELELEEDWSKFPPNLTKLNLSFHDVSPSQILRLPRGLLHLTLPNARDIDEQLAPALFAALPPNLTRFPHVLVHPLDEVTTAALPRQIGGAIHAHVPHRALHLLPQGVTFVRISDFTKEEIHEIQGFPPSFDSISMSSLDQRTASLLPPHLKSITIDDAVLTPAILSSMPPNITELITVYGCPFESAEEWKLLGRDLNRLDAVPTLYHDDLGIPIPTICPESSSWLPSRIVFMTLGRLDIQHAEWFSHLPITLEILRLHVVSIPSDSFQHIRLPELKEFHLTLTSLDSAHRTQGGDTDDQQVSLENLLRTLPLSLEEFIFKPLGNKFESWNYCNEDLMHLPPFLHTLLLPESTTPLTNELLPYLPRTLTNLRSCEWLNVHLKKKKEEEMDLNKQRLLDLASQYGFPANGIAKMFETSKSKWE